MFDKNIFSEILKKIYCIYKNQRDFAKATGVNRAYISQYMNMKLDNPPTPKILKKIAENSKGVTTYEELMKVCGYVDVIDDFFDISIHQDNNSLPIIDKIYFKDDTFFAYSPNEDIPLPKKLNLEYDYFAYKISTNDMAPLLDIGDIAIIQKQNNYKNNKTYLLWYEEKTIIRKIIDNNDNIELMAMNPYYPIIKTTKDEIKIIGRVIRAENESAFK